MKGASNQRRFELESLEPRCLLSGAALAAVATPIAAQALLMVAEEQMPSPVARQAQSESAYDAMAQVGSILPAGQIRAPPAAVSDNGSAAPGPGSPSARGPAATVQNAQLPAVTVAMSGPASYPVSSVSSSNAAAVTAESQVVGSSVTEQLTETLRAANAPPGPEATNENNPHSFETAPLACVSPTGILLSGIPLIDQTGTRPGGVYTVADALEVRKGDILSGSGTMSQPVVVSGTISPGNSPGRQETGSQTWTGGAEYVWEINDVDSGEGTDPGWDTIHITGGLTITATTANKFSLKVSSLTLANASDNTHDFNAEQTYSWRILSTTTGITGFNREVIAVSTAAFTNPIGGGVFVVDLDNGDKDLVLRYLPVLPATQLALPAWTSQGPDEVLQGGSVGISGQPVSGAIQAVAVHPFKPDIVFVGSVNGGVWRTTNANAAPLSPCPPGLATVGSQQLLVCACFPPWPDPGEFGSLKNS